MKTAKPENESRLGRDIMQPEEEASRQVRTIVIAKETSHYRIVTDDPDNWRVVANRPFACGELVAPEGTTFHADVRGIEFADVILEPTRERKRVYTAVSAVPSDAGCSPAALEFP